MTRAPPHYTLHDAAAADTELHSHGIQMINKYIKAVKGGFVKPGAQPVITDTGGPILIADANGVWGQVAYAAAMEAAIAKAKRIGNKYLMFG